MGQTKVSVTESSLDEFIQKSEFPKLKTSKLPIQDRIKSEVSKEAEKKSQVSLWIFWLPFVLQVCLFFITLYFIHQFHQRHNTSQISPDEILVKTSDLKELNSSPLQANPEQRSIVKPVPSKISHGLTISDFDRPNLKTNLQTSFIAEPGTDPSRRALKISLDSNHRYGLSGNALRIEFLFNPSDKPAAIEFYLPGVEVSKYRAVSFQLRSEVSNQKSPRAEIQLKGSDGKVITFDVNSVTSSWKKYELNFKKDLLETPNYRVNAIRFLIDPDGDSTKGIWYLDNLAFE